MRIRINSPALYTVNKALQKNVYQTIKNFYSTFFNKPYRRGLAHCNLFWSFFIFARNNVPVGIEHHNVHTHSLWLTTEPPNYLYLTKFSLFWKVTIQIRTPSNFSQWTWTRHLQIWGRKIFDSISYYLWTACVVRWVFKHMFDPQPGARGWKTRLRIIWRIQEAWADEW